tara:strand:- start:1544 stop:1825 length:282 start_codon:yes stop_codon:yes gene_type:complete
MKYLILAVLLATSTGVLADRKADLMNAHTTGVCLVVGSIVTAASADLPPSQTKPFKDYLGGFTQGSGMTLEDWGDVCRAAATQYYNQLKQVEA